MKTLYTLIIMLTCLSWTATAQIAPKREDPAAELKRFYDGYAQDLIQHRREGIGDRYDRRGVFVVGNGDKQLISFEKNEQYYLKDWAGPKAFEWRDLSFEVLSPSLAVVVGFADLVRASGDKITLSYTALLVKQDDKWRIRIEDESLNSSGTKSQPISGNRNTAGILKYTFTAQPGASISAHRHSTDMKITVKSGRKFILMGDLENSKVQKFEAGATFVIPANTWHVEWWETETVEEIEMTSPTKTERATPATPRGL